MIWSKREHTSMAFWHPIDRFEGGLFHLVELLVRFCHGTIEAFRGRCPSNSTPDPCREAMPCGAQAAKRVRKRSLPCPVPGVIRSGSALTYFQDPSGAHRSGGMLMRHRTRRSNRLFLSLQLVPLRPQRATESLDRRRRDSAVARFPDSTNVGPQWPQHSASATPHTR